MSRTYEIVGEGVTHETSSQVGLFIQDYPELMERVLRKQQPGCFTAEELPLYSKTRVLMLDHGVRKVLLHTLRDRDRIVGFVAMDFMKHECHACCIDSKKPGPCRLTEEFSRAIPLLEYHLTNKG